MLSRKSGGSIIFLNSIAGSRAPAPETMPTSLGSTTARDGLGAFRNFARGLFLCLQPRAAYGNGLLQQGQLATICNVGRIPGTNNYFDSHIGFGRMQLL